MPRKPPESPPRYYMIFNAIRQGNRLSWPNIVGVFKATTPEFACRAAAKRQGTVGTYFAVEGFPWGIEMEEVEGTEELGSERSLTDVMRERQELELELLKRQRDELPAPPS